MGAGWMNLGSLLLGLAAWILPCVGLLRTRKGAGAWYPALSLGACALALFLQICYGGHLVAIEDWSALMDTAPAVGYAAACLLAVTAFLNLLFAALTAGRRGHKT